MNELRSKDIKELMDMVVAKKSDLEELSQNVMRGKENNVNKIKLLKKEIARIRTVISEKNLEVKENA